MARAKLLQFVAPNHGTAIWLPATEGLWEWQVLTTKDGFWKLRARKLLLVRGCGPRGDDGLCMPVVDEAIEGDTSYLCGDTEHVKSVRELPAGYWTFLRPLQAGDPEIPGA